MTKEVLDKTFKWFLTVLGVIILIDALYVTAVSRLNIGTYLTYAIGIFILFCSFIKKSVARKIPLFIRYLFIAGVVILTVFVSFIYIYGNCDNVDYEEDAIIVLGAGLRGENVSQHLKNRLDAVIEYHEKNENALIVVSGGQGPDEIISEAEAMERYLIEKGIDPKIIIKEDLSTSTEENFSFSKEKLDELLGESYKIAYVTNDFHIYRAGCRAKSEGFDKFTHYGAKTPLHSILPNGLREVMGVLEFWVFDEMERSTFGIPLLILY